MAPGDVIVVHDELDLPFGDVRVKRGGGHAGHNGLRSVVQHLGTQDFIRVRLGIGRPPPDFRGDVASYVLAGFGAGEKAKVPEMVDKGAKAVLAILSDGLERAMIAVNTRPKAATAKSSTSASATTTTTTTTTTTATATATVTPTPTPTPTPTVTLPGNPTSGAGKGEGGKKGRDG